MSAFVIVLTLAALCVLSGAVLKRVGLRGLTCTRAFSRQAVFEGEEAEMIEVVRNDRPVIIPWLRVESHISPYLRLGKQDNLHVSDEMYYCSLFTLMPYQQIRRRHRVRFLHRGYYDLGNASLTAGDVLGLYQCSREQAMSVPVTVYPRLLGEDEVPEPLARLIGETAARRQLLTDPFLVRGIRPYQPGDPVRDIHWPATARMGDTQLRVRDYTAQTRLLVVFNAQRTANQWGEIIMDYEEGAIEEEISMAATLCVMALHMGLPAGFAANMPMDRGAESALFLPVTGRAREEELLTAFAHLTVKRTLRFVTFLETLTSLNGMDMLILSCYDSEEVQQAIGKLRRAGNQVTLHLLDAGRGKPHAA